jgi:hypothetical protein
MSEKPKPKLDTVNVSNIRAGQDKKPPTTVKSQLQPPPATKTKR